MRCDMKIQKMYPWIFFVVLLLELAVAGVKKEPEFLETTQTMAKQERKKIAITFDDGPSPYTETLLEELKKRNVKATFFVIGQNVEHYPEILKEMQEAGHLIGNHTYHHVEISKLSLAGAKEEVDTTNQLIESITHEKVVYVRPPFGIWKKELEKILDVYPVMWSVDPLDWTTENVSEIVEKVVTETEENDIILLHDCYKSSVEAALRIIDLLEAQGFEFVTVNELIMD